MKYLKTEECWKDVVGYEGFYKVSNMGRVKTFGRMCSANKGGERHVPEVLKVLSKNARGYPIVSLSMLGKQKTPTLHRLVAMAFIPNPHNKPQVNHIDGDKQNNHVSNLEWNTHQENITHAYKNGLRDNKGENNSNCRLSDETIAELRQMKIDNPNMTTYQVAKKFGLSQTYTWHLLNGSKRTKLTTQP